MHVVRKGGRFSSDRHRFYKTWGLIAITSGALLPGILVPFSIPFSVVFGGITGLLLLTLGLRNLQKARNWQKGIIGEECVVEALGPLDNTYVLINDVVLPNTRGNIDHILIGPNAIFVIETKSYRWHPFNRFPLKQTQRNAILLRQFLKAHLYVDLFIQAILVSTDPRSRSNGRSSTVHISTLSDLCDTLTGFKNGLHIDHDRQKQIVREILRSQSSLSHPRTHSDPVVR